MSFSYNILLVFAVISHILGKIYHYLSNSYVAYISIAPFRVNFYLGGSMTTMISSGALRRSSMLHVFLLVLQLRSFVFFFLTGSRMTTRVFLEATWWTVLLREGALWRISYRHWGLSSKACQFCCQTMLNMLFNSLLVPCILSFTWRVWRSGKASGFVAENGTWFSIGLTWIDMANCEAQTIFGRSKIIILGSTVFYSEGRGGWLLAAKEATTTSRASMNHVALDPTITDDSKNLE